MKKILRIKNLLNSVFLSLALLLAGCAAIHQVEEPIAPVTPVELVAPVTPVQHVASATPVTFITPASMVHRAIEQNTLGFQEEWRRSTLFPNTHNFTASDLYIVKDRIIYSEYRMLDRTKDESWLVSILLENGTEIWRTKLQEKFGTGITSSLLDSQSNRIFLLYSFRAHAFDLNTGQLLWESEELGQHREHVFLPGNINPLKISSSESEIIDVNPSNGKILQQVQSPDRRGHLIQHQQIRFTNRLNDFTVENVDTGETLWQYQGHISLWPVFLAPDMIYQSNSVMNRIRRVNIYTGDLIWETGYEYVSNIAVDGERLYAINEKGCVVQMDIESGQVLGMICFDRLPENLGGTPFWVVTDPSHLLVFFGDEPEIISFRK